MFNNFWKTRSKKNGYYVEWILFHRVFLIFGILLTCSQAMQFYKYNNTDGYTFSTIGRVIMLFYILSILSSIVYEFGIWSYKLYAWHAVLCLYASGLLSNIIAYVNELVGLEDLLVAIVTSTTMFYYYGRRKVCFDGTKKYDNQTNNANEESNKNSDIIENNVSISKENNDIKIETDNQISQTEEAEKAQLKEEALNNSNKDANSKIRFCRYCGAELNNEASFCHKCGKKVG